MSTIEINITIIFNKNSGESELYYYSDDCGSSQASELCVGITSNRFQVIHQEAYYDEILKDRRSENNILSSWSPRERLALVGSVWGTAPCIPDSKVSLGNTIIEALVFCT
jgi:hypothetical protein